MRRKLCDYIDIAMAAMFLVWFLVNKHSTVLAFGSGWMLMNAIWVWRPKR